MRRIIFISDKVEKSIPLALLKGKDSKEERPPAYFKDRWAINYSNFYQPFIRWRLYALELNFVP